MQLMLGKPFGTVLVVLLLHQTEDHLHTGFF